MVNYQMEFGSIQAKDVNPAAPGLSTAELTNPTYNDNLEAQEAIITGEAGRSVRPLKYLIAALAVIVIIGYMQK